MDEEVKPRVEHPANTHKILAAFPGRDHGESSPVDHGRRSRSSAVSIVRWRKPADIDQGDPAGFLGSYEEEPISDALFARMAMRVDLQAAEVDPVSKEHAIDAGSTARKRSADRREEGEEVARYAQIPLRSAWKEPPPRSDRR